MPNTQSACTPQILGHICSLNTTTSLFTISGLTNGTSYSVSIKAVNEIGDSIASNTVAGIPIAPTTVTVAPTATVPVLETVEKADSLPKTGLCPCHQ